MSTGYIIREVYLQMAAEKPGGSRLRGLDELARLADEIGALEQSFAQRAAVARGHATELSPAAMDEVAASSEADVEVHRLLLRRCRRSESARGVLVELLDMAEDELALDVDLHTEFEASDPAVRLHQELIDRKREVVARLKSLASGSEED